jgi:hypothetical protein
MYSIADVVVDHLAMTGGDVGTHDVTTQYFVCNERLLLPQYKGVETESDHRVLGGLLVTNRVWPSPGFAPDDNGWTVLQYSVAVDGWSGRLSKKGWPMRELAKVNFVPVTAQEDGDGAFRREPQTVIKAAQLNKQSERMDRENLESCALGTGMGLEARNEATIFGIKLTDLKKDSPDEVHSNGICTPCNFNFPGLSKLTGRSWEIICGVEGSSSERQKHEATRFANLPGLTPESDGSENNAADNQKAARSLNAVLTAAWHQALELGFNGGLFSSLYHLRYKSGDIRSELYGDLSFRVAVCNEMVILNGPQKHPLTSAGKSSDKMILRGLPAGEKLYAANLCLKVGLYQHCAQLATPLGLLKEGVLGTDAEKWRLAVDSPYFSDLATVSKSATVPFEGNTMKINFGTHEGRTIYKRIHDALYMNMNDKVSNTLNVKNEAELAKAARALRQGPPRAISFFFEEAPKGSSVEDGHALLRTQSVDSYLFGNYYTATTLVAREGNMRACNPEELSPV